MLFSRNFFNKSLATSPYCLNTLLSSNSFKIIVTTNQQTRNYAARKGKRIQKALEARRKAQAKKAAGLPVLKPKKAYQLKIEQSLSKLAIGRFNDSNKPIIPSDDVYFEDDYRKQYYLIEDAIDMHRQTHHPSILNEPEGLLQVRIELNMKLKKKTRFCEPWQGTLTYPHPFELKRNRRIIAVAKTVEAQEEARRAGAFLVGGVDIVKNLKSGLVTAIDFDHIVCHTDMLVNLAEVKGLLKSHFPSKLKANYGANVAEVVKRFYNGYDYKTEKYEYEPDFGWVDMFIGRISLTNQQLKENLIVLCNDLQKYRPADAPGQFIEKIWLSSELTKEKFLIKFWEFLENYEPPEYFKETLKNITENETSHSNQQQLEKTVSLT